MAHLSESHIAVCTDCIAMCQRCIDTCQILADKCSTADVIECGEQRGKCFKACKDVIISCDAMITECQEHIKQCNNDRCRRVCKAGIDAAIKCKAACQKLLAICDQEQSGSCIEASLTCIDACEECAQACNDCLELNT